MFKKIVTTAARIIVIWMATEAVRQVWNERERQKEGKKENK